MRHMPVDYHCMREKEALCDGTCSAAERGSQVITQRNRLFVSKRAYAGARLLVAVVFVFVGKTKWGRGVLHGNFNALSGN